MKVYIIGPMRGYPELNFPEFRKEAKRQRGYGHEVRCLAETPEVIELAEQHKHNHPIPDAALAVFMRMSLENLLWAERVVRLDRWKYSHGALYENQTAEWLGLELEDA